MKLKLLLFTLLLLCGIAGAQTAVTATVTDSDGVNWVSAPVKATFIPVGGTSPTQYTVNGQPFPQLLTTTTNSSGAFALSLADLKTISPPGGYWQIQLCPQANVPCQTVSATNVTGATLSLSAQISGTITAPRFAAGGTAYGYSDLELITPLNPGAQYYNTTLGAQRVWNGTWGNTSVQVFSVAGFGANNTGSAPAEAAVQNAITAASTAGGGIVLFPCGTYDLNNVTLSSNIIFRGSGQCSSIIDTRGTISFDGIALTQSQSYFGYGILPVVNAYHDVTFEDLLFTGTVITPPTTLGPVPSANRLSNGTGVQVGIYIVGGNVPYWALEYPQNGGTLNAVSNITVRRCWFRNIIGGPVKISGATGYVSYNDNRWEYTADPGMTYDTEVIATGNHGYMQGDNGMSFSRGNIKATITGNTIELPAQAGIMAAGFVGEPASTEFTITGNTIKCPGTSGINLNNAPSFATVSGNFIDKCYYRGTANLILTAASAISAGQTTYTSSTAIPAGYCNGAFSGATAFTVSGFDVSGNNTPAGVFFKCVASTPTTLVLVNTNGGSGSIDTHAGLATFAPDDTFQAGIHIRGEPNGNITTTSVSSVSSANAVNGFTTYTGTFTGGAANAFQGQLWTVSGCTTSANNSATSTAPVPGWFITSQSTNTSVTVNNANGVSGDSNCSFTPAQLSNPASVATHLDIGNNTIYRASRWGIYIQGTNAVSIHNNNIGETGTQFTSNGTTTTTGDNTNNAGIFFDTNFLATNTNDEVFNNAIIDIRGTNYQNNGVYPPSLSGANIGINPTIGSLIGSNSLAAPSGTGCVSSCSFVLGMPAGTNFFPPVAGSAVLTSNVGMFYKFENTAVNQLTNACFNISASFSGGHVDIGIYYVAPGASTASLVWHVGAQLTTTAQVMCSPAPTVSGGSFSTPTSYMMLPGTYYYGYCEDNTTSQISAIVASASQRAVLGNGPANTYGTDATDTCTSGALPTTITIANITNQTNSGNNNTTIPYVVINN